MHTTTYCYGCEGNASFIRASVDALEGTLSVYFSDTTVWKEDSKLPKMLPALAFNENPRALVNEVAGAFIIFLATCFGKKVFDEFYDRLLKRPLAPFLDRLCGSAQLPLGKSIEIRDVVYLADIDLVVVIRAIVTAKSAPEVTPLILQAHRVAHTFIEHNGRKAPVHCHVIQDGKVSVEPDLFLSLEHQFQAYRTHPREAN